MSVLELNHICFQYTKTDRPVFSDLSYSFEKGKVYAIVGKSGVGKTTLLSLISGLTSPTSGSILLDGKDIRSIDRYYYRSHNIGVIFQNFNLLPKLTALENVLLSIDVSGSNYPDKKKAAMDCLQKVS